MNENKQGFIKLIFSLIVGLGILVAVFWFTDILKMPTSGTVSTHTSPLATYSEVIIKGAGYISFENTTNHSVTITTDADIYDKIIISENNGILEISFSQLDLLRAFKLEPEDIKITLSADEISNIKLSGRFTFDSANSWEADQINLETKGETSGEIKTLANELVANLNGQSSLSIAGAVFDTTSIKLTGNSETKLTDLSTPNVNLNSRGNHTIDFKNPNTATIKTTGVNKVSFIDIPANLEATAQGKQTIVKQ